MTATTSGNYKIMGCNLKGRANLAPPLFLLPLFLPNVPICVHGSNLEVREEEAKAPGHRQLSASAPAKRQSGRHTYKWNLVVDVVALLLRQPLHFLRHLARSRLLPEASRPHCSREMLRKC